MLIGILGDIHGNIDALNATLDYFGSDSTETAASNTALPSGISK